MKEERITGDLGSLTAFISPFRIYAATFTDAQPLKKLVALIFPVSSSNSNPRPYS
jgi:hypothetical protein